MIYLQFGAILGAVLAALCAIAEFLEDKPMPHWLLDITGDLHAVDNTEEEAD
ncbi:hypothetical protein [Lacticaseibacillus parakribbianus]|uniref:hypothetical protein n=1 Tax=Lacticaseibacillus parakribbianus TaxID=2970927 RepID=UPI0021CB36E7|nr:hypothetical protein [Lacticaseibacillus parakribbianus]